MLIVNTSAIFTETNSDSLWSSCIDALTRKYDTFSSYIDLMDEPLSLKCINNTVKGSKIHNLTLYEFITKINEGYMRLFAEHFYESFSGFCNTRVRHIERGIKDIMGIKIPEVGIIVIFLGLQIFAETIFSTVFHWVQHGNQVVYIFLSFGHF